MAVDFTKTVTVLEMRRKDLRYRGGTLHVGFTAPYAVYVHEDLEAHHARGTGAKFLEGPAREYRGEMAKYIVSEMRKGRTLSQALLGAGKILLAQAKKVCPVATGALRDSGFVEVK